MQKLPEKDFPSKILRGSPAPTVAGALFSFSSRIRLT